MVVITAKSMNVFTSKDEEVSDFEDENIFSNTSIFAKIKQKPLMSIGTKVVDFDEDLQDHEVKNNEDIEKPKSKFPGLGFKGLKLPKKDTESKGSKENSESKGNKKESSKLSNLMSLGRINGFSDVSDPETVTVSDVLTSSRKPSKGKDQKALFGGETQFRAMLESQETVLEKFFEVGAASSLKQLNIISDQHTTISKQLSIIENQQLAIKVLSDKRATAIEEKSPVLLSGGEEDYFKKTVFLIQKKLESFIIGKYDENGKFIESEEKLQDILST